MIWISLPIWLPEASAADNLLAPLFDTFATLFRKGVFEGALARYGYGLAPFQFLSGSVLVPFRLVLAPFWLPWLVKARSC